MAKKLWQYGTSPNPKTWQETADILKSRQTLPKKAPKTSGFYERLVAVENTLKEKK